MPRVMGLAVALALVRLTFDSVFWFRAPPAAPASPPWRRDSDRILALVRRECPPTGAGATLQGYLTGWRAPLTAEVAMTRYGATWSALFDPADVHPFVAADMLAEACSPWIAFSAVDLIRRAAVRRNDSDHAYLRAVAAEVERLRPMFDADYVSEAEVMYAGQCVLHARVPAADVDGAFRGPNFLAKPQTRFLADTIRARLRVPAVVNRTLHVVLAAHALLQIPGVLLAFEDWP